MKALTTYLRAFGLSAMLICIASFAYGNSALTNHNISTELSDITPDNSTPLVLKDRLNKNIFDFGIDLWGPPTTENDLILLSIPSCNNVTSPGTISGSISSSGFLNGPIHIANAASPSGGSGDLEIVWMISHVNVPNYVNSPHWNMIPGEHGLSLTLSGPITQDTYILRCARRVGCTDFFSGESNQVEITITPEPLAVIDCMDITQNSTVSEVANSTICGNHPEYAFWSGNLLTGNKYWTITNGSFDEHADGSASFTGLVTNRGNANWSFDLNVLFSGKTFTPPAGSPKAGNCVSDVSNVSWYYYTATQGVLTGNGALSGAVVELSRMGEAFQVEVGAHLNNAAIYGASGWLNFHVLSQPSDGPTLETVNGHGDFNFELPQGPEFIDIPSCTAICAGENLDLFATGIVGSGNYSYLWSTGETTSSINVNPFETTIFTVTITDVDNGGSTTTSIEVSVLPSPIVECVAVNGSCANNNLGSISVVANNLYTYAWVNDSAPGDVISTASSISDLDPGSYTLTVTDIETGCTTNCTNEISAAPCCNVTDPGEIGGGLEACGQIDGPIIIGSTQDPSGGLGDLEIVWMVSDTLVVNVVGNPYWSLVPDETGLTMTIPGPITENVYYIRCARRVGCTDFYTGESNTVSFVVHPAPTVLCEATNGDCTNNNLGAITANASDGTAPYTYAWDHGPTTQSISGLSAGTYSVTIIDAEGCIATCISIITENPCCNVTDPGEIGGGLEACGQIDGPIVIGSSQDPSGGLGDLEIVWMVSDTLVVNVVGNPYWSLVPDETGLTMTIPGPITENVYYIRCARRVGCTDFYTGESNTVSFVVHPAPTVLCEATNGDCTNNNLGAITANASDGTAPYTYAWDHGPTTQSISGLSAGTYSVTITDAEGCIATCSSIITENPCCNVTDPGEIGGGLEACGQIDGPIVIGSSQDPSGGLGDLEIVWMVSDTLVVNVVGNPYWSLVPDETGLTMTIPGPITENVYYIRCARRVGCTDFYTGESNTVSFVVNSPPSVVCNTENGDCGDLGSISVEVGDGSGSYTYQWSNSETSAAIENLTPGYYSVIVTDTETGCTAECGGSVGTGASPLVDVTCDSDPIPLIEGETYAVENATGCYAFGYAFWSNTLMSAYGVDSHWSIQDGSFVESLSGSAIFTGSFVNNEDPNLSFDFNVVLDGRTYTPPAGSPKIDGGPCYPVFDTSDWYYYTSLNGTLIGTGDLAGAILNVSPSGPAFQVGTGANANDANQYGAGGWLNFDILSNPTTGPAFDANSQHLDFNIALPTGPQFSDIPSCLTICAGESVELFATALPIGGNYTYSWSTGETTASISVSPGSTTTYTVTVTDTDTGCSTEVEITVTVNDLPTFACNSTNGLCGELGSATVSVSGGINDYSFLWSTGATGTSISGLVDGDYTVVVTDNETGCTDSCTVTIVNEPALAVECSSENGQCGELGSASVSVSTGTGPYTYAWSSGESTASISGLVDGIYSVTVTDANGCNDECSVTIVNEPELTIACAAGDDICLGDETGTASVSVLTGTGPYTYAWSNGETTASITGLEAGTYSVDVTDANGCAASCFVTVGSFPQPIATIDCVEGIGQNSSISGVDDSDPTCNGNPNYTFYSGNLLSGNKFWTITNGLFDEHADGTAAFTGTVTNVNNANWSFDLNVVFSGKTFSPPAGSPKDGNCVNDVSNVNWYYYTGTSGMLVGTGNLAGAVVELSRMGEAFQVGVGAHLNDPLVFGASGWLYFDILSQPASGPVLNDNNAHGDFNFELPGGPQFSDIPSCLTICAGESVDLYAAGFSGGGGYTFLWSTGETTTSITVNPTSNTTTQLLLQMPMDVLIQQR